MEYGLEWFWSVAAGSAGGAALIAIAAYLGRGQLSHWLSKDLERIKTLHQRELEAYKVSLIAEAERAKAYQDVRKAMAVRFAEKRFQAIDELHRAVVPVAVELLTFVQSKHLHLHGGQQRNDEAMKLLDMATQMRVALSMAASFLQPSEVEFLSGYAAVIPDILQSVHLSDASISPEIMQGYRSELLAKQIEADKIISKHLNSMLTME